MKNSMLHRLAGVNIQITSILKIAAQNYFSLYLYVSHADSDEILLSYVELPGIVDPALTLISDPDTYSVPECL
jgi:hypothetical protein